VEVRRRCSSNHWNTLHWADNSSQSHRLEYSAAGRLGQHCDGLLVGEEGMQVEEEQGDLVEEGQGEAEEGQ